MAAFLVRRLIGMAIVMFIVSVLVYVIFVLIPGGDPAERIAGRTANPDTVAQVRKDLGFDRPFYVQYGRMMKQIFTGELISYTNRTNVLDQIKQGIPATFSLVIGAGLIWLSFGVLVGVLAAISAGRWGDR